MEMPLALLRLTMLPSPTRTQPLPKRVWWLNPLDSAPSLAPTYRKLGWLC